jgi:hypothetical protein
METDFYHEVSGNGLYRTRQLRIRGTKIVVLHNSVCSAAVEVLNGVHLGVRASWLKAFEDETVRIAVTTI